MTLILIDFDGGLADTRAARAAALSVAAEDAGLAMDLRQRLARDGLGALALAPAVQDRVRSAAEALFLDTIENGLVRLRPGAGRLLAEAATDGMPVAVLPRGGTAASDALLFIRFGPDMLGEIARPWGGTEPPADGDLATALDCLGTAAADVAFIGADADRVALARDLGCFAIHTPHPDATHRSFPGHLTISDLGLAQVPFKVIAGSALGHPYLSPAAIRDLMQGEGAIAA